MKCTHCGTPIEDGKVYCPKCGKAIQMVPDYNAFEEDLLREIFEEENANEKRNEEMLREKQKEQERIQKANEQKHRQKILIVAGISLGIALIIIIIILIVAAHKSRNAQSFDYQYQKAVEAVKAQEYDSAISYLEKAISIDKDDVDSRVLLVDCYMKELEYDSALVLCQEIIRIDSSNLEAYKTMIEIYNLKNDIDSIVDLASGITDNAVLSLFADYVVTAPEFSKDEGTYHEFLELKLSSAGNNDIYYTTDGSDPTLGGYKYVNSIDLDSLGTFTIKAVCKNDKGLFSEIVEKEFVIEIDAPERPEVKIINTASDGSIAENSKIEVTVPEGCTAYYSWDGNVPDPTSESANKYYNPISIPEGNNVLTVILYDEQTELTSDVYRGNFVYYAAEE